MSRQCEQQFFKEVPKIEAFLKDITTGEDTFVRLGLECGYFEELPAEAIVEEESGVKK